MAKADGRKALTYLLGYAPLAHYGACLYYVWLAMKAAGAWTAHAAVSTAYQAWQASQGKHTDKNPPEGALIWLGKRTSDGNMDGDVFIAGPSNGQHAATDQPTWGKTGRTTIEARMKLTGREYLGWTDHIFECPITTFTAAPASTGTKPAAAVGRVTVNRPVKSIQKLVGAKQDGIYGPDTTVKVKTWQKAHGLTADGIWGPKSDAKGFPAKVKGIYADYQRALNKFGYGLVVDNIWGPKSSNALADFQRKHGLVVDRIVGPKTAAKLGL